MLDLFGGSVVKLLAVVFDPIKLAPDSHARTHAREHVAPVPRQTRHTQKEHSRVLDDAWPFLADLPTQLQLLAWFQVPLLMLFCHAPFSLQLKLTQFIFKLFP